MNTDADSPRKAVSRKPLMRSLGEFVGHLWFAARTDPEKYPGKQRQRLRHDVSQSTAQTPSGKVTLRRTTIEEMEIEPPR